MKSILKNIPKITLFKMALSAVLCIAAFVGIGITQNWTLAILLLIWFVGQNLIKQK